MSRCHASLTATVGLASSFPRTSFPAGYRPPQMVLRSGDLLSLSPPIPLRSTIRLDTLCSSKLCSLHYRLGRYLGDTRYLPIFLALRGRALVALQAHILEVVGSSPTPATRRTVLKQSSVKLGTTGRHKHRVKPSLGSVGNESYHRRATSGNDPCEPYASSRSPLETSSVRGGLSCIL